MQRLSILLLFLISISSLGQKRIGLTLSGGGAKGIFHIGILQAIDSAELNIDYVTGTSMGSIMGALYASGYTGKEMEKIARDLDWSSLFSGKPLFKYVNVDEKSEFGQYALELPFEKGKLKTATGVIEGQEIWLKFQELFLPIYDVKDFFKFSIPFKCIATDVSTGKAVVLDRGEIVTAIRASMAIPSVFTAIDYKDTKLVDGGVVRNFPVRDAINMGANYTIGVNLSQGLLKADKLNSPIDILYQIAFYKDADDFQYERKLCNILIEPPMDDYSAASFGSAAELIQLGKEWGKKYYPAFKKLADSLKAVNPNYQFKKNRLPKKSKITIDGMHINGLNHTTEKSFIKRLHLEIGKDYDGIEVAKAIRRVYGSRNYSRISYRWEPTIDGHANIIFDVLENPLTYFKIGLHYHTFSNVALLTTISSKNLLFDRSKSLLKLNISENFRALAQQNQTFGKQDNNNLILSFYHERFKFPIYNNFDQAYLYHNRFTQIDLKLQHTFAQHSALGIGTSYEIFALRPDFSGTVDVEAGNKYFHSYIFYDLNTLNQRHFATSGWRIYARLGEIYNQQPDKLFYQVGGESGIIDTLSFQNYGQLRINIERYRPLSEKFTLISQLNSGMNLKQNQSFLNFFNVGGLNDFLRNQITFAGYNEFQVRTNSVASFMMGFQFNPYNNLYTTLRANAALYNFNYDLSNVINSGSFLSGYSFTVGYASVLGPIQISAMYGDQSRQFSGYVNIGFHF
ncbi:MAG TPA: patatin-like phospholipase family protein [Cyclobacteriaceae bacterium]|jgi:NTE family protein|nr:patatin-like phospholipase family protein [Cyclobacteriaceae bacterium]